MLSTNFVVKFVFCTNSLFLYKMQRIYGREYDADVKGNIRENYVTHYVVHGVLEETKIISLYTACLWPKISESED